MVLDCGELRIDSYAVDPIYCKAILRKSVDGKSSRIKPLERKRHG